MDNSEILFKAALNRLAIRLGKKIIVSAEQFSNFSQETQDYLKKEWNSFKEEVIEESERMQSEAKDNESNKNPYNQSPEDQPIQSKIKGIRNQINHISVQIEEIN